MSDLAKNEDAQEPEVGQAPEAAPSPEAAAPAAAAVEENKDARMWGTFCHLSGLLGLLGLISVGLGSVLGIVGPLVVWLIKKDEYEFVSDQGKESLNFQITVLIAGIACLPLILDFGLGLLLLFVVAIADVVFVVIASMKANQGERYRYPVCIRFIK